MMEQYLLRIVYVLLYLGILFVATVSASFSLYRYTKGQTYQVYQKLPKRFMYISFIIAMLIGTVSVTYDLILIVISPLMSKPFNVKDVFMSASLQCILILVLGFPIVWFSFRVGLPLAHKIWGNRLKLPDVAE